MLCLGLRHNTEGTAVGVAVAQEMLPMAPFPNKQPMNGQTTSIGSERSGGRTRLKTETKKIQWHPEVQPEDLITRHQRRADRSIISR